MKKTSFRIPPFAKSFYFLFAIFFVIWMFFFDSNDFINQWKMRHKLQELKEEKEYYQSKISEVKEERKLLTNQEELEKFARENYLMKKQTEDVYVLVPERK